MEKLIHQNSKDSFKGYKKYSQDSFRRRIYEAYKHSESALTDREVMRILAESDVNNIRPEITRLKQDGLLVEVGKTQCKETFKTVRIIKISGKAYFNRNEKPKEKAEQLSLF